MTTQAQQSARSDQPVKALIWDLDGVLVDSEPLLFEAERLMLADYGAELTMEAKAPFVGLGGLEVIEALMGLFDIDADPATLGQAKMRHYLELAKTVPGFAPTIELAGAVHGDGIPMAIASGSTPEAIDAALEAIGLADAFTEKVSTQHVSRGKPAPDVFLFAAEKLGVPVESCVVVEDSAHGVEAAHAAGMRCIAIPSVLEPLDPGFGTAEVLVAGGMTEASSEALIAWVRERY